MLLISEFRDELRETHGELKIEWEIANFFALCQEEGCYYESSVFTFARSSWNLKIFPGGNFPQEDSDGYISIYLKACSLVEPPTTVTFMLGIKRANGILESISEIRHSFDRNLSFSGNHKFYQRSELLRRKNEIAPTGNFTIFCVLKHDSVKMLEITTHQMKLCELERLSSDFKDLLSSKRSYDAIVKVKDKEFQVHKSLLIARSPVFESMFEHDMLENKTGVITIKDSDPNSFGEFLKYLYTGKAENVTARSALDLYSTADKYDVQELKSFCVAYMIKNMTPENVCDIVILADDYDETQLFSAAQVFFNRNMAQIFLTDNWETFLNENPRLANKLLKGMAAKIKTYIGT